MKVALIALNTVISLTLAFAPATAAKLTMDPNKSKPTHAQPKPVDPLAQKITYTSTDKRLHTVLEELSEMTGVKIHCGKSPEDWKVRDLPVVVCVNDLSLGKTLRSIAEATHLALTPITINGEKHYRIWRDGKRQRQLDDYFQALEEAAKNRVSREWDAWLEMASDGHPDSSGDSQAEMDSRRPTYIQDWGKVVAALPSDAKDKVLAGEEIRISAKTASPRLAGALRTYFRNEYEAAKQAYGQQPEGSEEDVEYEDTPRKELTEAIIDGVEISISDERGSLCFEPNWKTLRGFAFLGVPEGNMALLRITTEMDDSGEPEPPETDYSRNLRLVDPDDCKQLGLSNTIKPEMSKDKRFCSFADVIADIARASGYTFICEDFTSHREYCHDGQYITYGEQTLEDALLGLLYATETSWYVDSDSRLVVGSCNDWWNYHRSLAPERVISALLEKAASTGIEIEDAASTLVTLSEDQRWDWVFVHKDLGFDFGIASRWEALWRLYAGLTDEGKALASSENGLPLSMLDRSRLERAFDEVARTADRESTAEKAEFLERVMKADPPLYRRTEEWARTHYPEYFSDTPPPNSEPDIDELIAALSRDFPEIRAALEIPRDSAVLPKLKMKLTRQPVGSYDVFGGALPVSPLPSYNYTMTIEGEGVKMHALGPDDRFPVYTQKRRMELVEEAAKKQARKPEKPGTPEPETKK